MIICLFAGRRSFDILDRQGAFNLIRFLEIQSLLLGILQTRLCNAHSSVTCFAYFRMYKALPVARVLSFSSAFFGLVQARNMTAFVSSALMLYSPHVHSACDLYVMGSTCWRRLSRSLTFFLRYCQNSTRYLYKV